MSATATREVLLSAARELFDTHGFRGTTLRRVGERAGVDQALIARYFGGKTELYHAVLADKDAQPDAAADAPVPATRTAREVIDLLLERCDERGVGPVLRALSQPELDPETRGALTQRLQERLVAPLERWLAEQGAAEPPLRAQLIVAMLVGVITMRANGALDLVAARDREPLAALLEQMLAAEPTPSVHPRSP